MFRILIFQIGLFSGFFSKGPHPEHRRKYSRIYFEYSFNDDSVFNFMVRDSNGSHSDFLPRAMNSEFPTLEAYVGECLTLAFDLSLRDF